MATDITRILNQLSAGHPMSAAGKVRTEASGAGTRVDANGESSSIAANDFLTLLVTEMKNQDPTANTDPNEYVNQLVQVNSLEQLISINEILQADSEATANGNSVQRPEVQHGGALPVPPPIAPSRVSASSQAETPAATTPPIPLASGNLSISSINPAALRVAEALAAHSNNR